MENILNGQAAGEPTDPQQSGDQPQPTTPEVPQTPMPEPGEAPASGPVAPEAPESDDEVVSDYKYDPNQSLIKTRGGQLRKLKRAE